MIFFALAWIFLFAFIFLEIIKLDANPKNKRTITEIQKLFIIFMIFYSLIGIVTNDPISELVCKATNICLPATLEWWFILDCLEF
ncbi:MAG: hypothetical protein ACOYT4_03890 [Nanoarchaeota archaeon]